MHHLRVNFFAAFFGFMLLQPIMLLLLHMLILLILLIMLVLPILQLLPIIISSTLHQELADVGHDTMCQVTDRPA